MKLAGEPPAPEQATGDTRMTNVACPGRAPETLSAAPVARVLEATDTSGSLLLSFDSEGASALASLMTAFVSSGCPGEKDDVDP